MEQLLLGELGGNAATAHQIAPGMFSFRPGPPTEEEIRQQAAADARNEPRPSPSGFDFSMIPDLSLVHRAMIPGVWNRVRMGTFPENWCVLGFDPDSQEQMGAHRGSHTQVVLEAYGHGGLANVIRHLRADSLQFCGFRVSMKSEDSAPAPEPEHSDGPVQGGLDPEELLGDQWFTPGQDKTIVGKYVFVMWVGEDATEFTRKQAAAQLLFFRDYFHHADVELVVAPPPGVPLDGKELQALIAAQLIEGLAQKGHAAAAEQVELDFTNRDATKVCTHYDWEISESDGSINDLDALSHALAELETAYADVDEEDREAADVMLETMEANLGLKKGFLDSKVNTPRVDTARTDTRAGTRGSAERMVGLDPRRVGSNELPMAPRFRDNAPQTATPLTFSTVTWTDTVPARPYRVDSREISPSAQFETSAARRSSLGGTGQVWIPDCCEQWRYFDGIEEQITRVAAAPETLSELVRVGEITDSLHPAYVSSSGPESGSRKSYLAYAAVDLKQHTVLGFYGGVTKTVQEAAVDEIERANVSHYGLRLQCTASWGRSQLEIDAAECGGNELRYVNDYRTDVKNYDDPSRQLRGGPNAKVCEVWLEGEPTPRACFITIKAIGAGDEITIDYSNGFWETELGRQAEEEASATGHQVRSDRASEAVQDGRYRSVALRKQHDAERAAAEACAGGVVAADYEKRWVAEQRAQIKAAILRLKTELDGMQDDFCNTADELIDLARETLRLQHEADREETRATLLEGAGGAKAKLAARLAARKVASKAHG